MFQKVVNVAFALFFFAWGLNNWFHGFRIPFFTKYPGNPWTYYYYTIVLFVPALLLFIFYKTGLGLANKHQKDHLSFIMLGFALLSIVSYLALLKFNVFTMS
jgi:hypothetical protein